MRSTSVQSPASSYIRLLCIIVRPCTRVPVRSGCVFQPGKRCAHSTNCPPWRSLAPPNLRCQAGRLARGWLIRLADQINTTWPHPSHVVHNGAADAIPAQHFHQCLLSHLPPAPDLIVLEFGSMARNLKRVETEALVRRLLALPSQPHILFFNVREWCSAARIIGASRPSELVADYPADLRTPHARVEELLDSFSRHYPRSSAISYHRGLELGHLAGRRHFARSDIAADCLHPGKSRFGNDYAYLMFHYWLQQAVGAYGNGGASDVPAGGGHQARDASLPPPMLGSVQVDAAMRHHAGGDDEMCFAFGPDPLSDPVLRSWSRQVQKGTTAKRGNNNDHDSSTTYVSYSNAVSAPTNLPWATGVCSDGSLDDVTKRKSCIDAILQPRTPSTLAHKRQRGPTGGRSRRRSLARRGPAINDCPTSVRQPEAPFVPAPPTWVYCELAQRVVISPSNGSRSLRAGKLSPGAIALTPNATLLVPLPWPASTRPASLRRSAAPRAMRARLRYLTSYEHMGMARVACVGSSCSCLRGSTHLIDAYRPDGPNESVFANFEFSIVDSVPGANEQEVKRLAPELEGPVHPPCALLVQVASKSLSGVHKFKVVRFSISTQPRMMRE